MATETNVRTLAHPAIGQQKRYTRRYRVGLMLSITRQEHSAMQKRARLAGLAFATWVRRCAMEELERPPRRF